MHSVTRALILGGALIAAAAIGGCFGKRLIDPNENESSAQHETIGLFHTAAKPKTEYYICRPAAAVMSVMKSKNMDLISSSVIDGDVIERWFGNDVEYDLALRGDQLCVAGARALQ